MIQKVVFFLTLFAACFSLNGQNDLQTTNALARQAKDNGEFEKAITYFEDLYKKTFSETYYNSLIELYPEVGDFKSAEKLVKRRIKKLPKRPELIVDLGHLQKLQGEEKESKKSYESAIDEMDNTLQSSRSLSNAFLGYQEYQFAEKTYLKARKKLGDDGLFTFELATAYAQQGKTDEMVEEYLDVVGRNRGYLQTVQNLLQRVLNPDPDGLQMANLKEQLLRKIQRNPNQEVYSELLIWLYIQDKNFQGAFIQARALDRRASEDGKRLYTLGNLCLTNKAYDVAEQSFQYVIKLGPESPYYLRSKLNLVDSQKAKVIDNDNYSQEDLIKLKTTYEATIEDLGKSSFTLPLIRGLADLQAYYLDRVDTAIDLLQQALTIRGVKSQEVAKTKLDLADLMLLNGEIWEASLLYSQVEKSFKYDRLGEIAKFKNAKVAFYSGDFYWAQAQLDVLKGSTSKLIANDAMNLSLLITDNVGLDSIAEPLEMYARADLLIFKKDYTEAIKVMDSIPKFFPATSLKDDILFAKYKIANSKRNYSEAAELLKSLLADYAEDLLGDNALFELAKLKEERLNSQEEAMELYKKLMTTYPSSLFVVESRKRFRALRGDKPDVEIN